MFVSQKHLEWFLPSLKKKYFGKNMKSLLKLLYEKQIDRRCRCRRHHCFFFSLVSILLCFFGRMMLVTMLMAHIKHHHHVCKSLEQFCLSQSHWKVLAVSIENGSHVYSNLKLCCISFMCLYRMLCVCVCPS